jgi:hypothetical protein
MLLMLLMLLLLLQSSGDLAKTVGDLANVRPKPKQNNHNNTSNRY